MKNMDWDIKSMSLDELRQLMEEYNQKPFRAKQLYEWMHKKRVWSYDEMTNLPGNFRELLKETYPLQPIEVVKRQISKIDGTQKVLFRLRDGNVIESVLMKYKHGNSICISSQAGCRMGCRFCASTLDGLTRNLLPSEMLEQVYRVRELSGEPISNIVIMGTGEPLDNYDHVLRFLRMVSDEKGLNISQRNITMSTCGLVPKIRQLAEEKLQITLALSLHAPDDEKRQELMPIARKYKLDQVIEACRYYFHMTGRRLTFEYSLVAGVNDSQEDAEKLSRLLKGMNCHVNLIPVNPIKERNFKQSNRQVIDNFKIKLEKYGINVTIRREMGSDIDGACGQLRKRYMEETEREIIS
jgi:23S rRNA (adenine2503-C2)-methyltransferase